MGGSPLIEQLGRAGLWAVGIAGLAISLASPSAAKPVKGELAPDFTGTALDGRKIKLSTFREKNPVVLSFFARFCDPCKAELAHLKELDEKFSAKGLRLISVSLDDDRQAAASLPSQAKVKFPVVFDPKAKIGELFAVQALPHTVIIGKDGKIEQVITGVDRDLLDRTVDEVLK
jgi:peroxiredoxin